MAAISSINILFRADLSQFSSEIQNASREMRKYGDQLQSIGNTLSVYLTLPIAAAGAASIKMASDYEESLNKVDVAFKNSSEQVKAFAKDSLESFGIAEGTALDMSANFGDMATSMGLTTDQAAKMATSLTGLAGDLASFKNIGIDEAITALNAVFTGETESLKRLGIVLTEANLQTFALSKGIKTQVKDMDQASKVNLRYAYIMANTTNAQGDFERTGGGAANQMRIFQESLKQLGQQFGSIILPAFTKLITAVNSAIKGFGELSPATKGVVVVLAGVAAGIGPLLSGFGKLLTFLPNLALAVKGVGESFDKLKLFLAYNPYIALAAAIALIGGAIYSYINSVNSAKEATVQLTDSQKFYQSVTDQASASIVNQKAKLEILLATARNENDTKKNRLKAIQEINKISPEYLKNLTLENINTDAARQSIEKYNKALLAGAMARAANSILEKNAQGRIEAGFKREKALAEYNAKRQEAEKQGQEALNKFYDDNNRLMQFANEELERQNAKYDLQDKIAADIYSKNKEYLKLLQSESLAFESVAKSSEKLFKKGTESYFENQIKKLRDLQQIIPTTNAAWQGYEDRINEVKKSLDALTNKKVNLPKPSNDFAIEAPQASVFEDTLGGLKDQKSYYEALREQFSKTSEEYNRFSETINGIQLKINKIEGVEEAKKDLEDVKGTLLDLSAAISSAVQSLAEQMASAFGVAIGNMVVGAKGMSSLFDGMFKMISDFLKKLGESLIQAGVAGLAFKKALLSPFQAIASGIALVAFSQIMARANETASNGVVGSYANGGIIPGNSPFGDKLLARVNSGEMILNKNQQRNAFNMINSASTIDSQVVVLDGGFEIEGTKLKLVLERADKKKNRIG